MPKTLRDVAKTLYDVPHSVSCKVCKANNKCKLKHEKMSCVDCIEEGIAKLIDRATPKKVKVTIISKEHGSYQCDCYVCGCFLSVNCKDVETKFCRECGQAISWEDEDET